MSEDPVTAQRLRQGLPVFVALASILLVVATLAALYLGREILVPVTLAILLSFVLVPAVRVLRRLRVPRAPAVLLVVVIVFGALFGIGSLIASEASQLASDLPRYTQVMRTKIKDLRGATAGTGTLSRIVDMVQDLSATLQPPPAAEVRGEPGSRTHPLTVELTPARASVVDTLQTFAGPILHPLATTGLILIFTIFILLQREDLRNRAIRLAGGSGDLRRTTAAIDDATSRLSRFFLAQLALNIAFGLVIGFGLWMIGVPSPTLFGVLAAILRFVPYIGAAISALLPLILAAAVDPGWGMVIATAVLFLVVEPICGHVVEPLLYGHSTGLSPVAVILAATIWTFLWGPIGLVLATPLTVCLVVLGRHVERLWYLDVLLGDQPALSPPEIFYQRMLAGDPVEAIDQGWQFLKERALVTYYDEVALAGLLLAQEDLSRGTLDRERQAEVGAAIRTVVDRLGTAPMTRRSRRGSGRGPDTETAAALAAIGPDRQVAGIVLEREDLAPNWRSETPVLCVSSRGPFDEAATLMLSQILARHGLASQILSMAAIRAGERPDNPEGLALICFSYLEPVSLSQIRFTVRQARAAVPGVRILVGFWRERDPATLERLRRATSADFLVTSLNEALSAVLGACQESAPTRLVPAPVTARSGSAQPAVA
ncbi:MULTISPECIES: AI-2E family transporter [Methylobacterium]|uniref:AI-2E family transporter n=1 Tax=Methylobacterium TaxID=407 RepID=UPI0006AEEDCD|nr:MULTISPECIES: AI-2E family transporter [unclassified Methylobacterium]MDE4911868.1 AI-2E family transporter [Methylobacterium sp. 092160098-2]MDH3028874.1 AI-2E family transporter [Methylobacterium fujisawaense]RUP14841.1 MAG: AI-2E family transporter [Methylobacterium sp.]WFS05813.1 AI-2E family transporter [Methylobacterium sp. 391_Methyba4]